MLAVTPEANALLPALKNAFSTLPHSIVCKNIKSIVGAIFRSCNWLNFLGLLDEMKLHPNAFKELFAYKKSSLTALTLIDNILLDMRYSPQGSNARLMENEIISWRRDYAFELEGIFLTIA